MEIRVSNKIYITNPDIYIKTYCRMKLVLDNPDYHKKLAIGKSTYNTPKDIKLYEVVGNTYILPFGCIADIYPKYYQQVYIANDIGAFESINYKSGIKLYPYQENAVNKAVRLCNGILLAPCGSGKTQMGLELVARLKGRTLWLTHTKDLLKQSMDRAKAVLGIDAKSYGTITDGKVNIGTGITFATVQTMAKLDLTQYKDVFDCVVVDEVQHCAGSPTRVTQFYKVVSALSCRYKYGLTATLHRADGLEQSIKALLGDVVAEVSKNDVKDTTAPVKVIKIPTEYYPDLDVVLAGDGTIEYSSLVADIVSDTERFELVSNTINNLDGSAIVLANRIEYLQWLESKFDGKSICISGLGNSKASKRLRENAIDELKAGNIDCLFATYQLAKEGLDVPNLRYVVFATPEKDLTTVTQSAGRVGRKAEGKEYGTVIDFVDSFGMLKGWSRKRDAIYKKLEYEVM